MGNACRPCEEIFFTESGCIKKNEEASCQSAGGNLFQIHCISCNLWYCGVGKLQLLYYGLFKPCSSESHTSYPPGLNLEKLNWLPIS